MDAVGRSVYVAGLGPGSGKSIVALGVAELLSRQVGRIGVFQPLAGDGVADPPAASATRSRRDGVRRHQRARPPSCWRTGSGRSCSAGSSSATARYERLAPATVVIGTDAEDSDDPRRLGFNARLAIEFGSVVVAVVDGPAGRTRVATGVPQPGRPRRDRASRWSPTGRPTGSRCPTCRCPRTLIPETPAVSAPTVAEMADALDAAADRRRRDHASTATCCTRSSAARTCRRSWPTWSTALWSSRPATGPTSSWRPAPRTPPATCRWPASRSRSARRPPPRGAGAGRAAHPGAADVRGGRGQLRTPPLHAGRGPRQPGRLLPAQGRGRARAPSSPTWTPPSWPTGWRSPGRPGSPR